MVPSTNYYVDRTIGCHAYGPRGKEGPSRTSAESMVRAYQRETQRQKLMVKKGKLCEARLLSVSAACKDIRTAPPVNA